MGRSKNPKRNFTGNEAIYRPDVPVSRPLGDIGIGGGPGVPPTFPRRPVGRRRRGEVGAPGFPSGQRPLTPEERELDRRGRRPS